MKKAVLTLLVLFVPVSLASVTLNYRSTLPPERFGTYQLGDDTLANEVRNAGLSYVVRQYRWEQIETEQDVFNFNNVDTWYDSVLEPNGLGAIITLRTGQSWATDNSYNPDVGIPLPEFASAPPLSYVDYYDYIYQTVDHLEGRIDHFIIENDPLTKLQWYGTPDQFKLLTGVAYRAAKDANPDCVVLGNKFPAVAFGHLITRDLLRQGKYGEALDFWNGYNERREGFQVSDLGELLEQLDTDFSWWLDDFTTAIMTAGQAGNLDAIAYNYYVQYEYIDEVIDWLNGKMAAGGFSLPLWDLEHGIKDEHGEVTEVQTAGELVKGYAITMSHGIPYIAWYPFTIDSTGHNFENLKPMYDFANGEFLAPYFAMQVFSRHITPSHLPHSAVELDYSRYTFKNVFSGRKDTEIVWSDAFNGTLDIPFRPGAGAAVVTHFLGGQAETIPNADDTLVVDINTSPRFIRWLFD